MVSVSWDFCGAVEDVCNNPGEGLDQGRYNSQKFPADRFLCGGDWRLGDRKIPTEIHKHNEYICKRNL